MKTAFCPQQRILLWLACSAIFFEAFDVSIVNLALPLMAADLRVSLASAQWVQTIYLLSFGGCLLLGGRLCDHAGSKRIYLAGMLIFGVASFFASISHQMLLLLPARAGQGFGAALAMPAAISLLSRHFKEEEQHRVAFGIFGAFAAIGFAGGLSVGGVVAAVLNWHYVFGINVPVIVLVLVMGALFIPEEALDLRVRKGGPIVRGAVKGATVKRGPLPIGTACWLTITLLSFSYVIHEAGELGWKAAPCLLAVVVSGVLLLRFDGKQEQPFFEPGIYSSPVAIRGLIAFFLLGTGFLSFIAISTLALQEVMGWGVRAAGWLLFPFSIGSAVVSRLVLPRLFKRAGVANTALFAMLCLLAGAVLLGGGIFTHRLPWYLAALLLVNSVAIAIGYPALTILSLTGVRPDKQGITAGLQSSVYTVGSGIGLSVTGLCLRALTRSGMEISLLCASGVVVAGCGLAIQQLSVKRRNASSARIGRRRSRRLGL